MKALLLRITNVANDRVTRVLFYDQTLKKGYASLASFSKLFILRRLLITLIAYPFSLASWVFLIVLNQFTPVRIYRFKRPQRPGFASVYIEQLEPLCRELQATGHKGFLIFIDASQTTNLELLKLYATHFNLYLDDRMKFFRTIIALIPRFGFTNTFVNHSAYDTNWELPPATNLKTKGKTETPTLISQLELEPFKFVILTHRSFAYDKKYHQSASAELNRSTDISKAEDAIRLIHARGLRIVRMGVLTDELPDSLKHLPIIDLSGRFRTDAQDLWLSANCLFLWGINGVGTWHLAHKYSRPTLVTNSYVLPKGYKQTFFTFQLVWDKSLNRLLTLREMISLKGVIGGITTMHERSLTFVQNSSDQLMESVMEVLDVLGSDPKLIKLENKLLVQYDHILSEVIAPPRENFHTKPCISFLDSISEILE